jgi:hypothetical protein
MFKELDLLKICCGNVLPLKTKTKITSNTKSHILFSQGRQMRFGASRNIDILILIYLSTATGLTPGGGTNLHIKNTYSITINNKTTWITNKTTQITNLEEFAFWTVTLSTNSTKNNRKMFQIFFQNWYVFTRNVGSLPDWWCKCQVLKPQNLVPYLGFR